MNYELALELKKAGWPQIAGGCWVLLRPRRYVDQRTRQWIDRPSHWIKNPRIVMPGKGLAKALDWAITPTLSELIEASGEVTVMLWGCKRHGYYASSQPCSQEIYDTEIVDGATNGTTPEEAVARLWLSLNTKS